MESAEREKDVGVGVLLCTCDSGDSLIVCLSVHLRHDSPIGSHISLLPLKGTVS